MKRKKYPYKFSYDNTYGTLTESIKTEIVIWALRNLKDNILIESTSVDNINIHVSTPEDAQRVSSQFVAKKLF